MNVREVVQLSGSWDDERDALGELNKTVMPILIASLDYDIQNASEQVKQVIESGVSIIMADHFFFFFGRLNFFLKFVQNVTKHDESTEITPKPKQPLTKGDVKYSNNL